MDTGDGYMNFSDAAHEITDYIVGITTRSGRTNITVGCHQMNRKTDTENSKAVASFVDHYIPSADLRAV